MLSYLHWFFISCFIGLLIGIERERRHPQGTQALGVRTFALLAVLGTFSAIIDKLAVSTAITLFAFLAILLGYLRTTRRVKEKGTGTAGLTTEISAAIVYCLGYLTPEMPLLAAVLAGGVLLILIERKRIHYFSRDILTRKEIESAVVLMIYVVGVVPFLPVKAIDPWGLINLHFFGLLMAVIASIQFIGYVAIRILGEKLGLVLFGFFGGLASSTAVFVNLPRIVKKNIKLTWAATAAALAAVCAKLIVLLFVLFATSLTLFKVFLPPVVLMLAIAVCLILFLISREGDKSKVVKLPNPLDIKSILKLTIFVGGMFTLVAILKLYVGNKGVNIVSFLGALFELHGSVLAVAMLYLSGKIQSSEAVAAINLAVFGSFFSKYVLIWILERNRFALLTSIGLTLMLLGGGAIYYVAII